MAKRSVIKVVGPLAGCSGAPDANHAEVVLRVRIDQVSTCPACGEGFRRVEPPRMDPTAWPKAK